jgi:hypothetical protein
VYGLGGPAVRRVTLYSQAYPCDRSREASPPLGSRSLPPIVLCLVRASVRSRPKWFAPGWGSARRGRPSSQHVLKRTGIETD